MSHSLTFTLSFMCGEMDAIVITRSPQTEMGCKHTPFTCEVRMQPVACSGKFYSAVGQRHLGCPTQPEIDPPKQCTEEMSELANSLLIWTWSDTSLSSVVMEYPLWFSSRSGEHTHKKRWLCPAQQLLMLSQCLLESALQFTPELRIFAWVSNMFL